MQKTRAPSERNASLATSRAGRQARRRGAVWLVPPATQDEATRTLHHAPQTAGSLALDEDCDYISVAAATSTPACVLIVEDDPHVAGLLRRALEMEGHTNWAIDVLSEGHAALLRARETAPNIVLLDVALPDMDGAEVYRSLRASAALRECQIVFLTGSNALDLGVRGVEGGILLRKPFDIEQVTSLVSALIDE